MHTVKVIPTNLKRKDVKCYSEKKYLQIFSTKESTVLRLKKNLK